MTRNFSRKFSSVLVFVGAVVLLVSGCGRPSGSVTGKITYQGKPLKGGNVSFHSTEGRESFAAAIKEDGTYEMPKILGGSYKVCVETASLNPPNTSGPQGAAGKNVKSAPPAGAELPEGYKASDPGASLKAANLKKYVPIPEKYGTPDKTDLTYEFKGGSETFDIDLK